MPNPIVLYSTNTWLAYMVSQRYYKGEHYVWCAPFADHRSMSVRDAIVPPSSSPLEIYRRLNEEIVRGDRHSPILKRNKLGILRGADVKRRQGIIDDSALTDIVSIVDQAEQSYFRPLLYIIPFALVARRLRKVPIQNLASPLLIEYIIDPLPRSCFDIIEF